MQKTLNFFMYLTVLTLVSFQTIVAQNISTSGNLPNNLDADQISTSTNISYPNQTTPFSPPDICMVSVDSNNNTYVVWKQSNNPAIRNILVYRQDNSNGKYHKVATINAGKAPEFVDLSTNASKSSFSYRLAVMDKYGHISSLNNMHKSMHLTAVAGPNGSFQLHWNTYNGFAVKSYRIYRGSSLSNMIMIAQVPANNTSYTDFTPPSGDFYYQVEVLNPNNCNPSGSSKGKTNYLTSRSNHARCTGLANSNLNADFNVRIKNYGYPVVVDFNDQSLGNPSSWTWDFGDGTVSNNANPKHAYNTAGLYTIKLKVCNGNVCDSIIKQNLVQVLSADIREEQQQNKVQLYPNPNNGNFSIKIERVTNEAMQMQIMSTSGKVVYSEQIYSGGSYYQNINLQHLAKGIYYLRLQNSQQIIDVKKIIIQ
jgi:PKD repeat protein